MLPHAELKMVEHRTCVVVSLFCQTANALRGSLYVFTRLRSQLALSDLWKTAMAAKSKTMLITEMQMLRYVWLLNLLLDDGKSLED